MSIQRAFPVIPDVSRSVQGEFRTLRQMAYDLQDVVQGVGAQVQNLKKAGTGGAGGARGAGKTGQGEATGATASASPASASTLNVTQFLGLLAQAQRSYIPEYSALPLLTDPISQNGALISVNGILYRFDQAKNLWSEQAAAAAVLETTYAGWTSSALPPSASAIGTMILITDRNVIYAVETVAGSKVWVYIAGVVIAMAASRPTTGFNGAALGTNDKGLLFIASDTLIFEYWAGSSWKTVAGNTGTSGSFTPTLSFGGVSTGITYGVNAGVYWTDANGMVFGTLQLTLTSKGAATGAAVVGGLPAFTAGAQWAATVGSAANMLLLANSLSAAVVNGTQTIALEQWGATGTVAIDNTNFTNTSSLSISFAYHP